LLDTASSALAALLGPPAAAAARQDPRRVREAPTAMTLIPSRCWARAALAARASGCLHCPRPLAGRAARPATPPHLLSSCRGRRVPPGAAPLLVSPCWETVRAARTRLAKAGWGQEAWRGPGRAPDFPPPARPSFHALTGARALQALHPQRCSALAQIETFCSGTRARHSAQSRRSCDGGAAARSHWHLGAPVPCSTQQQRVPASGQPGVPGLQPSANASCSGL
jgi:hypothetical protein